MLKPALQDLLAHHLKLVVCGSAAGHRSAQLRQYYAGRGNKFWQTLAAVGLTPRELSPAEYPLLLRFGIGLTDLVKTQAGADHGLRFTEADRDALRAKILRFQPGYLCFNGKRAATEFLRHAGVQYGILAETIGRTALFLAPSTSSAANASWDLSVWQELAHRVVGSDDLA